jgi:hypothetical protein
MVYAKIPPKLQDLTVPYFTQMNTVGYPGAAILPAILNIQAPALGILVQYQYS